MGIFGSGNAISWTNRAKCPPIDDCPVKNAVGRPTGKQRKAAARLAKAKRQSKELKQRAKSGKGAPEPEPPRKSWPFAGSYSPPRDRGRGR